MELFIADLGLQVNPPPLLCVIHSTEAGDVYHTLLVNIHVAGYESRKPRVRLAIWTDSTSSVFLVYAQTWE
jgi:hypothetical protein